MGVDQHGQHAQGLVVFNESHASHIGGQVVNLGRAAASFLASIHVL
jgi:hypothetical protein